MMELCNISILLTFVQVFIHIILYILYILFRIINSSCSTGKILFCLDVFFFIIMMHPGLVALKEKCRFSFIHYLYPGQGHGRSIAYAGNTGR